MRKVVGCGKFLNFSGTPFSSIFFLFIQLSRRGASLSNPHTPPFAPSRGQETFPASGLPQDLLSMRQAQNISLRKELQLYLGD